ncbi:MAG: tetratricopeptide repeat protein, partial [Fluviibacter sp.]
MTLEPWALLILPLFFAIGWIAARIDIKHVVADSRRLPKAYFQGLNFLLNEQPDRAIEAFNEVVRVEPETVELHFALGALFRRRGELERALRIHQNLINREDLPVALKEQALFELGIDYLKSGLLDRSEEIFKRLSEGARREEALQQLLEIYQLEKSWDKDLALTALKRLGYARSLAEPNLTTLNGKPANLQIGGQFPVPQAQSFTTSAVQTVAFID